MGNEFEHGIPAAEQSQQTRSAVAIFDRGGQCVLVEQESIFNEIEEHLGQNYIDYDPMDDSEETTESNSVQFYPDNCGLPELSPARDSSPVPVVVDSRIDSAPEETHNLTPSKQQQESSIEMLTAGMSTEIRASTSKVSSPTKSPMQLEAQQEMISSATISSAPTQASMSIVSCNFVIAPSSGSNSPVKCPRDLHVEQKIPSEQPSGEAIAGAEKDYPYFVPGGTTPVLRSPKTDTSNSNKRHRKQETPRKLNADLIVSDTKEAETTESTPTMTDERAKMGEIGDSDQHSQVKQQTQPLNENHHMRSEPPAGQINDVVEMEQTLEFEHSIDFQNIMQNDKKLSIVGECAFSLEQPFQSVEQVSNSMTSPFYLSSLLLISFRPNFSSEYFIGFFSFIGLRRFANRISTQR